MVAQDLGRLQFDRVQTWKIENSLLSGDALGPAGVELARQSDRHAVPVVADKFGEHIVGASWRAS